VPIPEIRLDLKYNIGIPVNERNASIDMQCQHQVRLKLKYNIGIDE
jgi:hypothetical protein